MIISVPRDTLKITGKNFTVDFKFADNIPEEDDIMLFIDKGDVAPNNRFNYRYQFVDTGSQITPTATPTETPTATPAETPTIAPTSAEGTAPTETTAPATAGEEMNTLTIVIIVCSIVVLAAITAVAAALVLKKKGK